MGTRVARRGLTDATTKNVHADENVSLGPSEITLAEAPRKAQVSHRYHEHPRVLNISYT